MKLAIYGAGLFGQMVEEYCKDAGNLSVAGWFDKRYGSYRQWGLLVYPCDDVLNTEFDMMVIAILNVNLAKTIKQEYI